jgi:hypothetical protein
MDLYWAREVQHAPLSPAVDGHRTCTCSRWLRSAVSTSPSVAVPLDQLFTAVRVSFTPEMLSALVDLRSKAERQKRPPLVQAALCQTMTPTYSGSAPVWIDALLDPNTPFVSLSGMTVAPNQKTVRLLRFVALSDFDRERCYSKLLAGFARVQVRSSSTDVSIGSRATVSFTGTDRVYFKMQVLSDEVSGIFFGLTSDKAMSQSPMDM